MLAAKRCVASSRPVAPFRAAAPRPARRVAAAASASVVEIVEKLKTMTLLEAAELVKEIETTFGVDASAAAPMMMAAAPGTAAAAPVVEEKTTFDVVLEEFDATKKVAVYKAVRNICGIAVNQVKDYTSSLPKTLLEGVTKDDAQKALEELLACGAKGKIA
ncbi:hypothetical protein FOA52_003666 [Chlamydomonas sp. UWO 241]|nr:hypothetical protein FOA52_002012 [Chlamydomonas sp. UWO 241]KAG1659310.1 hypothetical protein FOA52_003666 [Chlamydomonas sp. UWO 241]